MKWEAVQQQGAGVLCASKQAVKLLESEAIPKYLE